MRQNQSLFVCKSAEAFFAELLKDDAETAGQVDHLQENWANLCLLFQLKMVQWLVF